MSRPIQVPDRQPAPSFVRERGPLLFATLISVFLTSACSQEIKREALNDGMLTLREYAIKKLAQGETTFSEVIANTDDRPVY